MAGETDRSVALFSIHPRFAEAILRGEKLVEFRRRGPAANTTHVIVYATAPVKRIVGWFRVGAIDYAAPAALWERFGELGAIAPDEYAAYYDGRELGSAITVAETWALEQPLSLHELPGGVTPPQSFRYVSRAVLDRLSRAGTREAVAKAHC